MTADKELYPIRGRRVLIQHMLSKPAKYGLKFCVIAFAKKTKNKYVTAESRYVLGSGQKYHHRQYFYEPVPCKRIKKTKLDFISYDKTI